MRPFFDRRATAKIARIVSGILACVLIAGICLTYQVRSKVNADSNIEISAVTKQTNIGPGDVVIIDVIASRMPGIVEFGPVIFNFDSDKADYLSIEQGSQLTNYVFTETQNDGTLTITGTDQMLGISSEGGEEEYSGASYYSEEPVVLFTITLRMFPESYGEINCWISDTGVFKSLDEEISTSIGNGVKLPVGRSGLSSDATIASLRVSGTVITPEFNPNITDYSCSVERSVEKVQVNVLASNLWAAVIIDGNQYLNMGDNVISIDVTAQDGVSHMRYTIHVTRKESDVPDNASLVDQNGNTYTFLDAPEDAVVPDGFYQSMRYVNGYSVPAYVKDGVTSVLLYLFDGTNDPGFYFYDSEAKTVIMYEPDITIVESSKILKIAEVPQDFDLPDEFKQASYDTGSMVLSGYQNKDGDFICYLSDEHGEGDFYYYNRKDGSISLYRFADKKAELLYSFLFDVFLVIAIIEAVIIIITAYIIRKMVSERTNPRPKRV